jgi:hypothetical protein
VAFGDLLGREMGFADFITSRLPAYGSVPGTVRRGRSASEESESPLLTYLQ